VSNEGTLIRVKLSFERDFTMIPNEWLRDTRLTFRARGILALLMSYAEGYSVTIKNLAANNPEGRDALEAAARELETEGYLERRKRRNRGMITGVDWMLTDPAELRARRAAQPALPGLAAPKTTRTGKPVTGYPVPAEPVSENPHLKEDQLKEDLTLKGPNQPQYARRSEKDAFGGSVPADAEGSGYALPKMDGLSPAAVESHADQRLASNQRYEAAIHETHPSPIVHDFGIAKSVGFIPEAQAAVRAAIAEEYAFTPCPAGKGQRPCSRNSDGFCIDCHTNTSTGEVQ
jgi:hypothetical protein